MGEKKDSIFLTGCLSIDLAYKVSKGKKRVNVENILKKYTGVEINLMNIEII